MGSGGGFLQGGLMGAMSWGQEKAYTELAEDAQVHLALQLSETTCEFGPDKWELSRRATAQQGNQEPLLGDRGPK